MAKKNKEQVKDLMTDKKVKEILDIVNKTNQLSTSLAYNVNQDFLDDNKDTLLKIDSSIKQVLNRYKQNTGENIVEFFTKLIYEEDRNNNKIMSKTSDLKKIFEDTNLGLINEIFFSERGRFDRYKDYEALTQFIPQISSAVNIYVDNIISPDDFTKDIFNIFYNSVKITNEDSDLKIIKNIKELNSKYPKLENNIKYYIRKALYLGDYFIAVLSLNKEFSKLLTEDETITDIKLTESTILLENEEKEFLDNYYKPKKENKDINWEKQILECLNNNIEINNEAKRIYTEYQNFNEDFNIESLQRKAEKFVYSKDGKANNLLSNNNPEDLNLNLSGSFIKELDPKDVVKIKFGNTCFGYYYIERLDAYNLTASNMLHPNYLALKTANDLPTDTYQLDPKDKLIADIFTKNICKKLNKNFLEKNQEFKTIIYELVKNNYITEKKIRVTYFNPDEVFHLCINEQEDGYGEGLLKPVLFTAKLYLSVLLTQLMMKITRSADHRTFYIETGLSKDVEGLVMSFIRDIKTKEIKLGDLNSIDNIFNVIGSFYDYFIPQTGGEKTVDIDTTPGMNVEMENEFLEFLRKTLISGLEVPPALLSYDQDIEFARSLASMNGKFIRSVISKQKPLSRVFTALYRTLYKNEYEISNIENKKDKNENEELIEYSKLEVKFPSPANLMMTGILENINTARDVIEFVVNTLVGTNASEEEKSLATKKITKHFLNNMDWESYENIIESMKVDFMEEKLSKKEGEE